MHNQTKRQVSKFSFQNSLINVNYITFWYGSFGKSRKSIFKLLASLKNILKARTILINEETLFSWKPKGFLVGGFRRKRGLSQ